MADIKLNFVNSYRDYRNGTMRHVFRRKGSRRILLKGRPGSAEFMAHYAQLLAQSEAAATDIGASKIKPGSIDALIVKYLQHDTFTKGLAKATQAARRPILDNFRQCKTPSGYRYGENRIATIHRKNISDALAGKTPIMQKVWMKALRHFFAFAIEQGDCRTDPTIGIKTARPPKTSGHVTWGDEQIEQYREQHATGTMARLALELMLNIAARGHDAHQIGRQHLRDENFELNPGDGDNNFRYVGTPGSQKVTVDLNAKTVTLGEPPLPVLFVTGDDFGWGWNAGQYVELTYNAGTGNFTATHNLTNNALFRFFPQKDWSPSYTYEYFTTIDSELEDQGPNDHNFRYLGTTGSKTITVNLTTKVISVD